MDHMMPEMDGMEAVAAIHALKSALAYIGEPELSVLAYNLEQAGRNRDIVAISSGTPAFLEGLRAVFAKDDKEGYGMGCKLTIQSKAIL